MQKQVTPEMIQALDQALAQRASKLKPFKKKGRTGWRNEFIEQLHATRAGPALRRLAIHFLLGKAPFEVHKRYDMSASDLVTKGGARMTLGPWAAPSHSGAGQWSQPTKW